MREIKFRGWDEQYKTWIFGDLKLNEAGDKAIITPRKDGYLVPCSVDRNSVGQFTGLKDSEGKEIYEGDIVLVSEDGDESKHEVRYMDDQDYPAFDLIPSSVRWSYESNGLSYCIVDYDANIEIRVIGNVHDNPDLLEVEYD